MYPLKLSWTLKMISSEFACIIYICVSSLQWKFFLMIPPKKDDDNNNIYDDKNIQRKVNNY